MFMRNLRRVIRRSEPQPRAAAAERPLTAVRAPPFDAVPPVEIAPDDPLVAHFQSATGAVDIDSLELQSPALEALRAAGMKLVVPLVSQGELLGVLNLGPRLSEQDYSGDDRKLLNDLATHAAPSVRVAQLVRQQEAEVRARERVDQELRVAQLIQQNFLPKRAPELPGWQLAAHYQPASEVGGDFYDFIELQDGRLGLVIGDVTDHGVPAALVMAATRGVLRAAAQRLPSPGEVLERVNEMMCPDIPPNMFATCLYGILDPAAGRLHYANAGHNVPYLRSDGGVAELRATGMPLGCMPGMTYEEREVTLAPGDSVLFHSDGLVEAHGREGEMFGFPRLMGLVGKHSGGPQLIDVLLAELAAFTGPEWHQEDDVTLVTLQRLGSDGGSRRSGAGASARAKRARRNRPRRVLADITMPSEPGNERRAIEQVAEAVRELRLPETRLERLKTAVGEATMNAMEHGNKYRADLPVSIRVLASDTALSVEITDRGGGQPIPEPEAPDIEAKLAGAQTARGWGLFLIKNMVDDVRVTSDETHHTLELVLKLEGDEHDS